MRLFLFLWCLWALARAQATSLPIDDTDARIVYAPTSAWSEATNSGLNLYNSTYHYTNVSSLANPNATVHFTFPYIGTAFTWRGFQRPDAGLFAICFDCSSTVVTSNWAVVDAVNSTVSDLDPPVTLFSISDLSDVAHNVTICNMLDPRANTYGQVTVDAFILTVDEDAPHMSSTFTTAPSSTGVPSSSDPFGSSSDNYQKSLSRGQIAGVVVGAVGALVMCAIGLVFCLRVLPRLGGSGAVATSNSTSPTWVGKLAQPTSSIGHQPSKMPIPFILPPAQDLPDKYADEELEDRASYQYAQSIDPPTTASSASMRAPRTAGSPGISRYPSISRWRTSTTTTEDESTRHSLRNASMSVMAGSLISAISGRASSPRTTAPPPVPPVQDIRLEPLQDATNAEEDTKEEKDAPPYDRSQRQASEPPPPRRSLLRVVNGPPPSSARRLKGPRPLSASPPSKRRSEPSK